MYVTARGWDAEHGKLLPVLFLCTFSGLDQLRLLRLQLMQLARELGILLQIQRRGFDVRGELGVQSFDVLASETNHRLNVVELVTH